MSRQSRPDELGFNSDSFLDIIANIVGILIILIVVAGVRVSNAPVAAPVEAAEPEAVEAVLPEPPLPEVHPIIIPPPDELEEAVAGPELLVPEPEPAKEPSPVLVQLVRDLEGELSAIDAEDTASKDSLQQLAQREASVLQQMEAALKEFQVGTSNLETKQQRLLLLRRSFQEAREKQESLERELKAAENAKNPANTIQHKLTPVSRVVEGKEIHFQLSGNRVAFVPLEILIRRLRAQISRQKNWLVKFHRHQGQVGPIDGFSMQYVVQRQQLSVIEELRNGGGMIRIGISEWQIIPEEDLEDESSDEALQSGSKFVQALYRADPQATITFWVYPDSFPLYRALQKFVHNEGFTVAARPLPFGVHIAGSPRGTRSAGQ